MPDSRLLNLAILGHQFLVPIQFGLCLGDMHGSTWTAEFERGWNRNTDSLEYCYSCLHLNTSSSSSAIREAISQ